MRAELAVVGILSAVLTLIPVPIFWRARNVAVLCLIGWLFICNMYRGINAVIWANTVVVKVPVWCDIVTKLSVGSTWAGPALVLCLCRYLAGVASGKPGISGPAEKRRRMILELIAGVGLPIVGMALHYIVQGHRFDIYEDFGCYATTYMSIHGIFITVLPPILFATAAAVYAGIALVYFIRRRKEFLAVLNRSQSGLTAGTFFRLIALSAIEMVFTLAFTLYAWVPAVKEFGLEPWVSWEQVHSDWLVVWQFPNILRRQQDINVMLLGWYVLPVTSVLFFAFFGCGQVANAEYRKAWRWTQQHVFRVQPKPEAILPLASRGGVSVTTSSITVPTLGPKLELSVDDKNDFAGSMHTISQPPSPSKPVGPLP